MRKSRRERAFLAPGKDPGTEHDAALGQVIDMPANRLAPAHMPRDPRPKPTGPLGGAAVQVTPGVECSFATAEGDRERSGNFDHKDIGAGLGRDGLGRLKRRVRIRRRRARSEGSAFVIGKC